MANSRVSRGRRTQWLTAWWFRNEGWDHAESIAASLPGKDIEGMPGWAPEVKATRDGSLTGAIKQAAKNAGEGETPFVVWRPDGYGEEKIGQWVVALSLKDFTELMRAVDFPQGAYEYGLLELLEAAIGVARRERAA